MKKRMKQTASVVWAVWLAASVGVGVGVARAQDAPTYDETATAESLGLEPFVLPDGLFPIFPWDHLEDWGGKYQPLDEGIKSMAECGCTLSAFVAKESDVEVARQNGLYCLYELRVDLDATPEEIDAHVRDRVESTKDDPTVLGYYLRDEPGAGLFPKLAATVAAVKKYAPGKLAYVNLFPGYASTIGADVDSQLQTRTYREYLERFVQEVKPQMLSYDNYMLEYSEDMRATERGIVFFSDLFEVRSVSLKYDLPFWFIGSSLCILEDSSPPTISRYACQAYSALAAGARGLTWFLYYPLGWQESPIDVAGRKTLSWKYMRDANEQARVIGLYLNDYRSTELGASKLSEASNSPQFPAIPNNVLRNLQARFSTNGTFEEVPKLLVGEFAQNDGENVAAMAVNLNVGRSVKIHFEKPDGFSKAKVVSPIDGSETEIDEETFARGFWILPGHGRLFVFEK